MGIQGNLPKDQITQMRKLPVVKGSNQAISINNLYGYSDNLFRINYNLGISKK